MTLDPEIQKLIEKAVKENRYDPDKDPVMKEFRRKMNAIKYEYVKYEPVDNTWASLISVIIFLVVIFLASR